MNATVMVKATSQSDSIVAMYTKVLVALLSLCISMRAEANFTLWVKRRSINDLYQLNSEAYFNLCAPNTSYLVNEKQCVLDEELFYGMILYKLW